MPGIRFNEPYLAGNELDYLRQVIENGQFAGNGPFTRKCHEFIERRYGVKNVLLTHSGTAALEMSALLLDLTPCDEVILPSYTFSTTASSFLRTGAKLIFCEMDPQTMMVDVDDIARKIGPNTKAIVPVHYAGVACDLERLMPLAAAHGIDIVEDAAQALESSLNGRPLGTFGRFGCVSFHETKNLHAGLAGALYVNSAEDIERATYIWERGTNRQALLRGLVDKYTWVELGSSFYPSEFQAAFLLAQLEAIDDNGSRRRSIYQAYSSALASLAAKGLFALPRVDPGRTINYHAFFLLFPTHAECERVRMVLKDHGIAGYTHFVPLHSSPMGQKLGYKADDLPVTEEMAGRILRMPLHNNLSTQDVQAVCSNIEACYA